MSWELLSEEEILATFTGVFERGWNSIKLYFMIGLPTETLDDERAIVTLVDKIRALGKEVTGRLIQIRVNASAFVPKPHTPFQWIACDSVESIEAKQRLLRKELSGPGMKLNWTDPKDSLLEAWLSRGDRRMAQIIYLAWKKGARFDAWQDQDNFAVWQEAFTEAGLDPAFYSHRTRSLDEVFPWDHIHSGVTKRFLAEDYRWSLEGKTRKDCR